MKKVSQIILVFLLLNIVSLAQKDTVHVLGLYESCGTYGT